MNSMNRYLSLHNSEKIIVFCIAQKNKLWLHNEKPESQSHYLSLLAARWCEWHQIYPTQYLVFTVNTRQYWSFSALCSLIIGKVRARSGLNEWDTIIYLQYVWIVKTFPSFPPSRRIQPKLGHKARWELKLHRSTVPYFVPSFGIFIDYQNLKIEKVYSTD